MRTRKNESRPDSSGGPQREGSGDRTRSERRSRWIGSTATPHPTASHEEEPGLTGQGWLKLPVRQAGPLGVWWSRRLSEVPRVPAGTVDAGRERRETVDGSDPMTEGVAAPADTVRGRRTRRSWSGNRPRFFGSWQGPPDAYSGGPSPCLGGQEASASAARHLHGTAATVSLGAVTRG